MPCAMAFKCVCFLLVVFSNALIVQNDLGTDNFETKRFESLRETSSEKPKTIDVIEGGRSNQQSGLSEAQASTTEGCKISETVVDGRGPMCKGALVFSEEFDQPSLDLGKWKALHEFPLDPDYPFNVYMSDSPRVENGTLVISPVTTESRFHEGILHDRLDLNKNHSCTGKVTYACNQTGLGALIIPPVITGKIITKHNFNFKYGRVEIRAKLPAGNWLVPELNLEPRDNKYGDKHYESGLMRVAYLRGNPAYSTKLSGGPVLYDSEPYRSHWLREEVGIDNWNEEFHLHTLLRREDVGLDHWNKEFHKYTLIWRPDSIEIAVDGVPYGTIKPDDGFAANVKETHALVPGAVFWLKGTIMAPFDQLFYISLGLRVAGVHDFPDDDNKPWRNRQSKAMVNFWKARDSWLPTWQDSSLLVDYVRVYAL